MGFIYCISPVQFLIEKIYNFEETDEKMPYSEALNRFSTDYNYENPIKQSYLYEFIEIVKTQGSEHVPTLHSVSNRSLHTVPICDNDSSL